jgi:hypothetical protein
MERKQQVKKEGKDRGKNRHKQAQATTRKRQERIRDRKWRKDKTLGRRNSPGKRANSRTQGQDDNDGTQDNNREFHNDQCSLFALIRGRRVNVKHEPGCGRPDIFLSFFPLLLCL